MVLANNINSINIIYFYCLLNCMLKVNVVDINCIGVKYQYKKVKIVIVFMLRRYN